MPAPPSAPAASEEPPAPPPIADTLPVPVPPDADFGMIVEFGDRLGGDARDLGLPVLPPVVLTRLRTAVVVRRTKGQPVAWLIGPGVGAADCRAAIAERCAAARWTLREIEHQGQRMTAVAAHGSFGFQLAMTARGLRLQGAYTPDAAPAGDETDFAFAALGEDRVVCGTPDALAAAMRAPPAQAGGPLTELLRPATPGAWLRVAHLGGGGLIPGSGPLCVWLGDEHGSAGLHARLRLPDAAAATAALPGARALMERTRAGLATTVERATAVVNAATLAWMTAILDPGSLTVDGAALTLDVPFSGIDGRAALLEFMGVAN